MTAFAPMKASLAHALFFVLFCFSIVLVMDWLGDHIKACLISGSRSLADAESAENPVE